MNSETKQRLTMSLQRVDRSLAVGPLILHLSLDLFLAACLFMLMKSSFSVGVLGGVILLPALMFRSFALMHDASHGAVSKNRVINDLVGLVSGCFCLLPYIPWREVHLAHHSWTGNREMDPSMRLIHSYDPGRASYNRLINFCWKYWIPFMALMQHIVFWKASIQRTFDENQGTAKKASSLLFALGFYSTLGLVLGSKLAVLLPGLLVYLVIVEIINFPHHLGLPQGVGETKLSIWDQHKVTRSCHYPRWFARHFLNNFNLHNEHHIAPKLPWYRLDEVSSQLSVQLGADYKMSVGNSWIIENRRRSMTDLLQVSKGHDVGTRKVA